ncbi:CynX/NimT family MFS transporter [Actinomadura scrupuli]|uniref:CynX/NimT family MFS transporter n=1 Tax=Actinomadura scrupuli TaxID=559629 RepID=UPI003D963E96
MTPDGPDRPKLTRTAALWTLAGLVLLALNLRTAISGVSPLLGDLQRQFGLSGAAMGVLTTLPVLSLGAFAAVGAPLARRFGPSASLTGALLLIVAGILVRLIPAPVALFAGTALAGAGIAIGNVLMPYVIKRVFPHRIGGLTGLAMMVMSGGAAVAAGLAVPLDDAGGWRLALAVWALPALVAALVWAGPARAGTARPAPVHAAGRTPDSDGGSLLRNRLAWYVTGFMGMQSLAFYVLMSWLPEIMRDQEYASATAGLMLSVMMLLGIPTGLATPMLAARLRDQRPLVVIVMALMALGVGGLLAAPQYGWTWVIVLGTGTGSAFPLAYTLITLRAGSAASAARLSGMAQTTGYLLAGFGPIAFGALHDVTGGWRLSLAFLLLWLVPETLVAWKAARPDQITTTPPTLFPAEPPTPAHATSSADPACAGAAEPEPVRGTGPGPGHVHAEPKDFAHPVRTRRP